MIKKMTFITNTDTIKIIIQLQIGLEIALFYIFKFFPKNFNAVLFGNM